MGTETENSTRRKHLLIAGGRLQGTEIAYLARKAGFFITLADHRADAPASPLADRFVQADVFDREKMTDLVAQADYVFPAIEDAAVLDQLGQYCREFGTPYLFDAPAYEISSSKNRTNRLLAEIGVDIPEDFPSCGYPVICKPDGSSGSRGVRLAFSEEEYLAARKEAGTELVVQQYLDGPSYSLEVLGNGQDAVFPMVTEVITDDAWDCKRIEAPAEVPEEIRETFEELAEKINERLRIRGIFDIEVILHGGKLYVLEIDARFPSQTPVSIYQASGVNFVKLLTDLADGKTPAECVQPDRERFCVYSQILVSGRCVRVLGEHIMSEARPLRLLPGFCGADEMLTDYRDGDDAWRAIVILTGAGREETDRKWQHVLEEIALLQGVTQMKYTEG